jgi:superfamily I DNA and/or RNA helicase
VLFVDEAGQLSLPNVLAAVTAARNVVLCGDPQQLPHVSRAQHPGGVGASVLEHLLGEGRRTVDPTRGVLLDHTYRMHADVCAFISDLAYDGRLDPVERCNRQRIDSPGLSGTGLRAVLLDHDEARVSSVEEATAIADAIEELLNGEVTDDAGRVRPLVPGDIIVVTPYNAQRRCIQRELERRGGGAAAVRVGTVDKFQGQQAFVVFFSTANSTPDDAPRGVDFLFDRNRLNVAISRARALAVYVGSPELLRARPTSIARMGALAAGCGLVEAGLAGDQTYVR